jgi:serine protease Do
VDLALVKIEATGLPVADLGDSNRLRVGELVLALGHPFGLEQTVSFGIVSRKGAPLDVAAPGFDFIQTDAAINPGNSGGPLVSMAGEVIGVNSMAARNGSIGFAIPINLVKGLLPQLAEKGKVEWGWLGVSIAEVADEDVARYRLKEPGGVLVRQVVAGQPADKGGVKANDVILGVDGARVNEPRDLQRIISSTPVGKSVKLSMMREGRRPRSPSSSACTRQGRRGRRARAASRWRRRSGRRALLANTPRARRAGDAAGDRGTGSSDHRRRDRTDHPGSRSHSGCRGGRMATKRGKVGSAPIQPKNYRIDVSKLERARQILGTRSETETIHRGARPGRR